MDINTIKKKVKGLSMREKLISAITIILVVFIAPYMFLYSPSRKMLNLKRQSLQSLDKEVQSLNVMIKEQAMREQKKVEPVILPEADDLQAMFLSISKQANIGGVDFISIAPQSVSSKDGFTEMKLHLELRAGYRQLYELIRYLGIRHKLFLIESLRFETNDAVYPSGITLIKAVIYLKR